MAYSVTLRRWVAVWSILAIVLNLFALPTSKTFGYTSEDIRKIRKNSAMYGDDAPFPVCGEKSVERYGNDNLEIILRYFTSNRGLSLAAASGIAGNFRAESRYNPSAIQNRGNADDNYKMQNGVGFGLAQWTYKDRQEPLQNLANQRGVAITSMSLQLDYTWKELTTTRKAALEALKGNKDDPGTAAYDFHRLFEGSADTREKIQENRIKPAGSIYSNYKGKIADGSGVNTDPGRLNTGGTCEDVGVGKGDYEDGGEVAGWQNVLANSQTTDRYFGTDLVGTGHCAAIVSRVWRGANIGYGLNYANDMWRVHGASKGHRDRKPKKGAILIYNSGNVAGHVMIYLGNNMVLNDGNITSAEVEKKWHLQYLGWFDPNDLGWSSKRATQATLVGALAGYR